MKIRKMFEILLVLRAEHRGASMRCAGCISAIKSGILIVFPLNFARPSLQLPLGIR
jgi:hypothetical protein